jgi:hypothetical protein
MIHTPLSGGLPARRGGSRRITGVRLILLEARICHHTSGKPLR